MKRRFIRPLPPVVLVLALLLIQPLTAGAQDPGPAIWSVQPSNQAGPDRRAHFIYELDAGGSLSDYASVSNLSNSPLTLRVYAGDAFTTSQGGFDLLAADRAPVDAGSWIKLESETVTVPPRDRLIIPFTLHVPANATPGDHAAGIVASLLRPGSDEQGSQVAVDYRVGSRVYLRVKGEIAPQLTIEDFRVTYTDGLNPLGGDMLISYTVSNSGNLRLKADRSVAISGPLSVRLRNVDLEALPEMLPGSRLTFEHVIENVPPAVRLAAELDLRPRNADGSEAAGSDVLAGTAKGSVWALPLTQAALLAGLAVAAWGWARYVRARRTEARRREEFATAASGGLITLLNEERKDQLVTLCRTLAGKTTTSSALIAALDHEGIDVVAVVEGEAVPVRIAWPRPLRSRHDVEGALDELHREAEAALNSGAMVAQR
jgi:Bacterial protein of unknown function (DUF916)/Protein of unknown function (DUF2470)